jgi:hypothetical protein
VVAEACRCDVAGLPTDVRICDLPFSLGWRICRSSRGIPSLRTTACLGHRPID